MKRCHKKNRNGFTLAEVLITLGIIGVVAALVIPVLNNKIQEQEFKTAYKKAFSEASQAINFAHNENLFINSLPSDETTQKQNFTIFMDQFKTTNKCINSDNNRCWEENGEKLWEGSAWHPTADTFSFIDSSGKSWSMYQKEGFHLVVDTNGFKKPNQWGKDRFMILILNEQKNSVVGNGGIPSNTSPEPDASSRLCYTPNKCSTENNYYGTSWLYN